MTLIIVSNNVKYVTQNSVIGVNVTALNFQFFLLQEVTGVKYSGQRSEGFKM